MKTEVVKVDARAAALRIVECLAGGLKAAAAAYKEFVDAGGDPMELRKYGQLSNSAWSTIDDVANGRIDPRIYLLPNAVQSGLRLLPASEQTKIIDQGAEVLTSDQSVIRVKMSEMPSAMADQVFSPTGIRSASEQASYLKAAVVGNTAAAPERPHLAYEVRGKRLVINEPITLTISDLHRIIKMMG